MPNEVKQGKKSISNRHAKYNARQSRICRNYRSGSKYQNWIYFSAIPHRLWWLFYNKTVKNPSWRRQGCPKLINRIMENNPSHKSVAKSMLYNITMQGFPLSSWILIWTFPVRFLWWNDHLLLRYISVFTNRPEIKSEISGVMWQVAPKYKFQLVSCELSPKSLLGIYALGKIRSIDLYIFCDFLWSILFSKYLSIFVNLYARVLVFSMFQWNILSEVYGFGKIVMKWSSNPHLKHVFGFWPLC